MSAPSLEDVLDAVHAWVVAGSGVAAARVLWAEQRGHGAIPIPDGDGLWISLRVRGQSDPGRPWITSATNPTPSAGAEIVRTVQTVERWALEIRAFGGDIGQATDALRRVMRARYLPTVGDALSAAGVGVGPDSGVSAQDGYIQGRKIFEPRALLDVTIFVPSEVSETGTNIAQVEVSGLGITATVDAPDLP